jgi:hypothetical protein
VAARGARAAVGDAGDRISPSGFARSERKIRGRIPLAETGYVEGRNITIEYRWGHGASDRLPELTSSRGYWHGRFCGLT